MAYPNVTAADVRNAISHVTTDVVANARITDDLIPEATAVVDGMLAACGVDMAGMHDLATTPQMVQNLITYWARALVLSDAYSESMVSGRDNDIRYWKDMAKDLVADVCAGQVAIVGTDGAVLYQGGLAGRDVSDNKRGRDADHLGPYFGYGDLGEHRTDPNEHTVYQSPASNA